MDESDPNDLINIRLADFLTPYQYLDDYTLNEYKLEETPLYAEEGYESPYGDGFETEEFNYQESDVEGETEIEENPEDDPATEETNPNEQTDPNQHTDPNTETNQEEYNEVPAEEGYNNNQDGYYDNSSEENYDDGSYY